MSRPCDWNLCDISKCSDNDCVTHNKAVIGWKRKQVRLLKGKRVKVKKI